MRLTPDVDRVRAAAIAPSTSNITAAEFDRFIAKTKADAWDEGFAEFERGHHASNYEPWEYTDDNPYRAATLDPS